MQYDQFDGDTTSVDDQARRNLHQTMSQLRAIARYWRSDHKTSYQGKEGLLNTRSLSASAAQTLNYQPTAPPQPPETAPLPNLREELRKRLDRS